MTPYGYGRKIDNRMLASELTSRNILLRFMLTIFPLFECIVTLLYFYFLNLVKGKKFMQSLKEKECLNEYINGKGYTQTHYTYAGFLQLSPYFEKSINNIVKVTFKILIRKKELFYREIVVNLVEASSVCKKD